MSRKKLPLKELKTKFSITINPKLYSKIDEIKSNKSKYIEKLIYDDLIKNNHVTDKIEL